MAATIPTSPDVISLSSFDVSFFVVTLTLSVLIGVYFANKNSTLEDYMLGGRDQKLWPVSLSLMTSFVSGLTLIGGPAEIYYHGFGYAVVELVVLASVPISAFILLPVFHRLGGISVFGYLEQRYHPRVKKIVSLIFILQMALYNSVVLYVPSLSLQSVLGISEFISIGCVGLACIVYSTLGGIKAVIWTDFYQAGLMFFALICICIGGTFEAGGLSNVIKVGSAQKRLDFSELLNLDLTTRHTLFNVLTGDLIINVFVNGANQIQVQRALSLPSLRQAQLSQLISAGFTVAITMLSCYIGLILLVLYHKCDPFQNHQINKRDAILIYYISTHLENFPGLRGIFVAGIFSATLSTLSSFQNSMSALVLEDFIKPSLKKPMSEKTTTRVSKVIALSFGVLCVGITFVVGRISGLLQAALSMFGSVGAPLVGAFFMGMMTRFSNTKGITVGMAAGYIVGIYLQFNQTFYTPPPEPTMPISTESCSANSTLMYQPSYHADHEEFSIGKISYMWFPLFSILVTVFVSTVVSLLTGGWQQQVADKYLVDWMHREKSEFDIDEIDFSTQKGELIDQMRTQVVKMNSRTEKKIAS